MAYNEKMTDRIRDALAHVPGVEEKRMFRGVAFMVDGKMCITIGDEEMMCRIDPEQHQKALEQKGSRTVIMKGREYKGWIYVHESALKTKKALGYWIDLALDFNGKAKASKKRPRA